LRNFFRRLKFSIPKHSDFIIFDEVHSQYLLKIINKRHSVYIIKQRPPDYFINFSLIGISLTSLPKLSLVKIYNHPRGILVGVLSEVRLIYYRSLILLIQPKAVVTFIDNNIIFNELSQSLKTISFIGIQNGLRLVHEKARNYHVQHLFSFGNNESTYFKNIGYEVEKFYPCGSFIASEHLRNKEEPLSNKYDILIVSCWRGNIGYPIDQVDSMNSMREMDILISKYIKKNNIKAAVAFRNERDGVHWFVPEIGKNEEEYFLDIYGNCVDLIDVDFKSRNIYSLITKSSLIVSGFSTSVLLDAYGFQKKIMYYNFTNKDIYHSIFDDSIVSSNSNFESFSKELDKLIQIKQSDYVNQHSFNMKHYMGFPEDYNLTKFISTKIDQIIEKN
jgi:surface carbohydrate biosynthesis protein